MGFAVSVTEFLLISGTIAGIGGGAILWNSNKVKKSNYVTDPVLNKHQKEPIDIEIQKKKNSLNTITIKIKQTHNDYLKISEKLFKEPRKFNYKPTPEEIQSNKEKEIKIQFEYAIEPDENEWKAVKSYIFSLPKSGTSIVKIWQRKDSKDSNNKKECRYSWDEKKISNSYRGKEAWDYLNQLKRFISDSNDLCLSDSKGFRDINKNK